MKVTLYTIGCPSCQILKEKLDNKNIQYETVTDTNVMQEKGFDSMPVLEVDNETMEYYDAVQWVNKQDNNEMNGGN
jgi:glutaredoxin